MFRSAVLFVLVSLFLCTNTHAAAKRISGQVLDEAGAPVAGVEISLNGQSLRSDRAGRYAAEIDAAEVYTLRFEAEGYFPVIHSFSPLELAWWQGMEAPAVTLVERKGGRVMMAFAGDAMMGRRFSDPYIGEPVLIRREHRAEDTKALLRHMQPYLALADFATLNLETQVMERQPEANAPKSYVFYTPPEAVAALKESGVDYVTLGNNHSNDYLAEGMASTLHALQRAGMPYSGAGMNEADALRAHRVAIGGVDYSFLGYVGWAGNFSPNQVAEGADKSGAALGSAANIERSVMREASAGFLPVVQYHGSREYTDEPTLVTETRLKQAIDDGAALAIAHHPHVVQGFEIYRDRLIAYSMGNFIFDQYHYATQYSYMVYVWMDGDRFHRAEVVPIHLQGYTPMPATDTVRRKVLARAAELSARRGIALGRSGGNGVITRDGGTAQHAALDAPASPGLSPLYGRAWNRVIRTIEAPEGTRLRLGQDLLPTGHLENHHLHGSPDRSWIEDGPQTIVRDNDGNRVMALAIDAGDAHGEIGMRVFEYTFEPGTPTTFALRARVEAPMVVTAYQQWRGRRDNRLEALLENPLRPIGRVELAPGEWRDLRFDFDSPRVSAISYRVVLHVEPVDRSRAHVVKFDEISLIEWLTPPLSAGELPPHLEVGQASHVDVL